MFQVGRAGMCAQARGRNVKGQERGGNARAKEKLKEIR